MEDSSRAPARTGACERDERVPLWDNHHANKDATDKYSEQLKEDVEHRRGWAEKVGLESIVSRASRSDTPRHRPD